MCSKFYPAAVVFLAVIMATAASVSKPDYVDYIVLFSRFFDIMLPVLAVGALIKYLGCFKVRTCQCGCDHCKQSGCKD